jgi:hypothetical protein
VWTAAALLVAANVREIGRQAHAPKTPSPDWRNYYRCADWIRENTPENAVVMCRKPTLFYLRSGRRTVSVPFTHNIDRVLEEMKKDSVTHIIYDSFPWSNACARYLYPVIINNPFRFSAVYGLSNPNFLVLELQNP